MFEPDELLSTLFGPQRIDAGDGDFLTLEHRPIDRLIAPTGSIVCFDPDSCDPMPADFGVQVSPGSYPVFLVIVTLEGFDQERITAAYVRLRHGQPSKWTSPKSRSTFLTESAKGAFLDRSALGMLNSQWTDLLDSEFQGRYLEEYKKHYRNTWSWVNTVLDETSGTNVLSFLSGMGDGYYPCHIGWSDRDEPVVLLIDFYVLYRLLLPPE